MSGVFGVFTEGDCAETLFYGTDYHSHLGTEFAGLAVLGQRFTREIHSIGQSQFKSRFCDRYRSMHGDRGIGVISALDVQPIFQHSKLGEFSLVSTGFIDNADELAQELYAEGVSFAEEGRLGINETELIAKLIVQGSNIVDGIEKALARIKGSCSLLLINKDGLYAARDRWGYNNLSVASRGTDLAVASESCAFANLGFKLVRSLQPGEIVLINENGLSQKRGKSKAEQSCSFMWIYTGFPASTYDDINVETVRERCGRALARRDKGLEADMVSGVPDSGVAHAIGYSVESGIPYRRPLVKYTPGYGRSYIPPAQETRDRVATMKLIPIKEIIEGNRIVVCEDSIVRGTQLKNYTAKKLWDAGAKEIHVRAACPPLMFPCPFNLSTRTTHELAARRAIQSIEGSDIDKVDDYLDPTNKKYGKMVDLIAKDLRLTSLRFQTMDDVIESIGAPRETLCTYCWTGKCPEACGKTEPVEKVVQLGRAAKV